MIRVYTDFNECDASGKCWLLLHDDRDFGEQIEQLRLDAGDRVILFQDGGDFEVEAVLGFGSVEPPSTPEPRWYAQPDWDTLKRF